MESLLRLKSELRLASAGYYRCRDCGGVSGKLAGGCIILFYICTPCVLRHLTQIRCARLANIIHTRSIDNH